MDDSDAVPVDALEDVAYLARSANRVSLLDALTTESYTRRDLHEHTGIARTTIGRILNEFEEREWIERTSDGDYTATPVGEQVIIEFTPLIESMAAIQTLDETVAWLQAIERPVDLHHFRDATVWRPDATDPMAPTVAYMDQLREADEFYCVVGVAPPVSFEKVMRDRVVEREMRVEHVISANEYAYLCEYPDRAARWQEYIAAGANVYRYAGTVPCNLFILDEIAYIAKSQSDYGEPYTVIESANDVVRSWTHEVIDDYREDAEQLDTAAFTQKPTNVVDDSK